MELSRVLHSVLSERVPWAEGEMGGALLLSGQSQVPRLSQADWFKFMCTLCRILISMCPSQLLINWWKKITSLKTSSGKLKIHRL